MYIDKKRGRWKTIPSKKPSIRDIAGKKINELEDYAIHSDVGRKLSSMIYSSDIYNYFSKKINEFRDIKLFEKTKEYPMPNHVAIIMDGNRRFAQELGLPLDAGHIFGRDKIEEVLEWCFDLGIKNLTIYAFSTENFQRSSEEVKTLMELCKRELDKAAKDSRIHKNQVRVRVIGHLDSLPKHIAESARQLMEETKHYEKYSLNIALAYSGREEIIQAIQKIASEVKNGKLEIDDIKETIVSKYLYTNGIPDPDIVLRTSGEERISNFLLWQLAYSELYFSDVYWPAFSKRDFLRAIRTVQLRQRRYGK
jgi:tritrans,polycis-undecaprenyl-diphosphate synthase [geranylgeranyl-diphosphate specific]